MSISTWNVLICIWDELGAKGICARVFSVEAPLKVGTKSFLTSAAGRREKKRRTPLHPTAYRSSRTIKRHSLFKSAPIHNTKWRRSTAPITALCIRNPSRTVTRRRHFVLASLPFPSFTLDPRPQKLDETAECRPRGRPPLLPSPSSSLLPRGSLHFPFIQIFRRLLPRKIPSAEISKISGRRKGLVRFIIRERRSRSFSWRENHVTCGEYPREIRPL